MISATDTHQWFIRPRPLADPQMRLFCFPYAGGGSTVFRRWVNAVPQGCELCLAELPGRGMRIKERPFNQLQPLAHAVTEGLLEYLDRPFVLFGHSMGAVLSFEIARILRRRDLGGPAHLIVSARVAPHMPETERPMHLLSDEEFLGELGRMKGTPAEVLQNAELMELMLPVLRADFAMCETYACGPEPPLACPITVLGGSRDTHVTRPSLEEWREHTSSDFQLTMIDGDHFFLQSAEAEVMSIVCGIAVRVIRREGKMA